jgi:hypothetical protein
MRFEMLTLDLMQTVFAMKCFASFAVVLQTLEYFQIRSTFGSEGIWSWQVLKRDFLSLSRPIFATFLSDRAFLLLLALRLCAALAAPFFEGGLLWSFLWFSTFAVALRWRGNFNGGSDSMMLIVLASLAVTELFGQENLAVARVCLGYVATQTCLSFFIAGVVKIRKEKWRSGDALLGFLSSDYYAVPALLGNAFTRSQNLVRGASWLVILFECLFPLALAHPSVCFIFIGCALAFQLTNAVVLGLNRFLWAWASAYPALFWLSTYLYERY